jgi:IS5 family transposase
MFCRIGPYDSVPHPTTLMKITTRCGPQAVAELNEALVTKADTAHLIKLDRLRADTTVVPANVAYPTDSGLLSKGVAKLMSTVVRLKKMGLATRTCFGVRTLKVRQLAHSIGAFLRRRNDEAKAEVLKITGELADLAEATIADARHVAANAKRSISGNKVATPAKVTFLLEELERTCSLLDRVVVQTRTRVAGGTPDGSKRIVSLYDSDARPIRKGRLGKPVEFGYKVQVADNPDGLVLDLAAFEGNPFDGPLLAPAVQRIRALLGRTPEAVTADRGYGDAAVEKELGELGVSMGRHPTPGTAGSKTPEAGVRRVFPRSRQVAHWLRRAHLLSQAFLGLRADAL